MNVTAELLDTFEFRKKGRGYDAEQVDELIARVRGTLGDLEARLADATARAEAAEARATDAEARSRTSTESDETIQRTLLLAQRTADAAVQEAEETAARKVADADAEAKRLIQEADDARARALANAEEEVRRSVEDSRTRLSQEIVALEQIRNTMMDDVERLEEHVEAERARLRASSDALTDLLSRTDRLGQVDLPELSDVDPSAAVAEVGEPDLAVETATGLDPDGAAGDPGATLDVDPVEAPATDPAEDAVADDAGGADLWSAALDETDGGVASTPDDDVVADSATGGFEAIDAPPPPPPPPSFDDDVAEVEPTEPPPPPPPPPGGDESGLDGGGDPAAAGAFGGLQAIDDLDPENPEDNAWLAELTDDEGESAGAGDGSRRRFGRRR